MKTIVLPLLAVALSLMACPALAQQVKVKDKGKNLNYRELVDGLVSPNKPIRITSDQRTISIAPNYDWKVQGRIEKNRAILYDHCEEALPYLIENCADARYSLVSQWSEDEDYYSWSVGRVCSEIIARHVEAFRNQMHFSIPRWHQYDFVPLPHGAMDEKEKKEIQDWWSAKKGMSPRELQLAAFDWAIAKQKAEREGGADELNSLISTRDKLGRSEKALPSGVMWRSLISMPPERFEVIPWTEKGE